MCCVGKPWDAADLAGQIRQWGEPLAPAVIDTAAARGLDPHALDHHVEAVHGWELHDSGYGEAVENAARCLLAGGCEVDGNPWRPHSGYHEALESEIRSGRRVDPDLWYNPQTGVVEVRPGTAEERRAAARAEGWRPGGE